MIRTTAFATEIVDDRAMGNGRLAVMAPLLTMLASGCAHFPFRASLSCPKHSGPPWAEYESQHFTVSTDLSPGEARALVLDFEKTYRSFIDITGWRFPGRGEPPGRMKVVIFERRADYEAIGPPSSDGYFAAHTIDGVPIVVLTADGSQPWRTIFLHEMTHRLLRYHLAKAPLWLHEGLAEFYSTFYLEKNAARFGAIPRRLSITRAFPSVRDLMECENLSGLPQRAINGFYAGSWLLVYVIARNYEHQFGDALVRMAAGEEADRAFAETFGPNMIAALEAKYQLELAHLYGGGDYRKTMVSWKLPYQPPVLDGVDRERTLDDGEVHLLWASTQSPKRKSFSEQLALAEAHGGDSARLRYMRGMQHALNDRLTSAEYDLRAAVAARPDEERYRVALARLHFQSGLELHWTVQQFAALAPEMRWLSEHAPSAESAIVVALYDVLCGQLAEARERAQHATEVDPTQAAAWIARAAVAQAQGDIDGAITYGEHALHVAPEGADVSAVTAQLAKLRQLRQRREQRRAQQDG